MEQRPKALDLFCGAGGVAMGLYRAGFDVVGVDIKHQKNHPAFHDAGYAKHFAFHQADAMTFPLDGYDFIWASPPCQAYSRACNNGSGKNAPRLIEAVRARLLASKAEWAIENVIGAPLRFATVVCGAMFGLGVDGRDLSRHRQFETSTLILSPSCQHRRGQTVGVYGNGTNSWYRKKFGRNLTVAEMREAMGIDWMSRAELNQAIPPAYAQFIGEQMMRFVVTSRGTIPV